MWPLTASGQILSSIPPSLQVDGEPVTVDYKSGKVVCGDAALAARVDKAVARIMQAMRPAPVSMGY